MRLKDRMRAFMAARRIRQRDMASKLRTPYHTFEKWVRDKNDHEPPGCMVVVMDALERLPEFRALVGIVEIDTENSKR